MTINLYIQRLQGLSDTFFLKKGRKPSMFIRTFGCQMNLRESEKIQGILLAVGYEESYDEEEADLILYNTCCVRQNAENKVYGKLGRLKAHKERCPGKVIVLCGCMPQREEVMEEINRHHKHVDIVFGTFNKHHFPKLLYEHLVNHKPMVEILQDHSPLATDEFDGQATRSFPHKTGVTIMYGCNNYCSYCIVPYVRGREKSRQIEQVLAETDILAADGVKEIMLLGQNVNSYAFGFPKLIKKINNVQGLRRIRFMTSHPKDLSGDLIDAVRDCDKVCKHIHLPVQSGSSTILKAMNRGYTKEQYLALIHRLRQAMPNIAITTDIIVGFPGETEEDFDHTLDLVKQSGFSGAFTFLYSLREGVPAANLAGEIPKDVAKERFNQLTELMNSLQLAYNQRYLGHTVEVMAEGKSDKFEHFTGRTDGNMLVHFKSDKDVIPGDIVGVEILECKTFYSSGKLKY